MNTIFRSTLIVQIAGLLLVSSVMAQRNATVIGTVGKEKAQGDRIVVCVLGTQACMAIRVDTTERINVGGSLRRLTDLPTGLYVEATFKNDSEGLGTVEGLKVDENKTVLCFDSLSAAESRRARRLLLSTTGVMKVEAVKTSRQLVVHYDSRKISYQNVEGIVRREGFALE